MNIGDLNISALYMGNIPASAYMGDQIVWPTESPAGRLEMVWDSGSTPEWYDPANAQGPAYAYHKARFNVLYNGQLIDSGDTGLTVDLDLDDDDRWIEIPHITDRRDVDGLRLYWHNGGKIQEYNNGAYTTASSRSFDVIVAYSGLSATTTITAAVQPDTGITFYAWNNGMQESIPVTFTAAANIAFGYQYADITYEADIEYALGQSTSGSIANQLNNYNHGSWDTVIKDNDGVEVPEDFDNVSIGWDNTNNCYSYIMTRTGGTGTDYVTGSCVWAGCYFELFNCAVSEPQISYSAAPLTIKMLTGGTIKWSIQGSAASTAASRTVYFTINEYGFEKAYEKNQYFDSSTAGETWDLAEGDFICFYGNNQTYAEPLIQSGRYQYSQNYNTLSGSIGLFEIEGNVMSLVDRGTFSDYGGEYYDPDAWFELSAATDYAFCGLFRGCTGLTNTENMVFPWYSLGKMACGNMFKDCPQLTKSPHLNAPIVTTGRNAYNATYGSMFMNCSSLREITCMATGTNIYMTDWVTGVPTGSTGDFYRLSGSTWTIGNNGMPSGWTVHNVDITDV